MKKINIKNKKVLFSLIIGFIILIIGIILIFNNIKNDNNEDLKNNNNTLNQENTDLVKIGNFNISNFEVVKNTSNKVGMVFKLTNSGKTDIVNENLDINMYENNKILYTYGYVIEDLKVNEYIYIQANASFNYKEIDKFEFVIGDTKVSVEPTYVD